MTAHDHFRAGDLRAALAAQIEAVRAAPADVNARLFLFELFLFAGDADRARKQLDLVRYPDPERDAEVTRYKAALDSMAARAEVLAGRAEPRFLMPIPAHAQQRLAALTLYAAGDKAGGDAAVARANELLPPVRGTINGEAATGARDGDDLFAGVLEVVGPKGVYCWLPLEQLGSLTTNAPESPRDLLLLPAQLDVLDGPSGGVLLPTVYADTPADAADALRLGADTEWAGSESEPVRGRGGRMFVWGDGTGGAALVDVRHWLADEWRVASGE